MKAKEIIVAYTHLFGMYLSLDSKMTLHGMIQLFYLRVKEYAEDMGSVISGHR